MVWDLPDKRLEERAQLCLNRIQANPEASFPSIFTTQSELLGFYRFINNEKINYPTLFASYLEQTRQNCEEVEEVLALHDTTIVKPGRRVKGLRPVQKSDSSEGFLSHLSLAVKRGGERVILGPCGILNWTRKRGKSKCEHLRWFEQVQTSEACFKPGQAIHVMDREGDSYYDLSLLSEAKIRFIIRSCHNRRLSDGQNMIEFISSVSMRAEKKVCLSRRKKTSFEKRSSIHPPRDSRTAILTISAERIEVANPKRDPKTKKLPSTLAVNLVRAIELNPPKGEKPVQWVLFTQEPIQAKEEVLKILESYQRRWLIEEYFKVLKTGCQLEERLMESAEAWYNVLTLLLDVATHVLNLRVMEEKKIAPQDHCPFTESEYQILLQKAKDHHLSLKTTNDALMVIAKMGGHIFNKNYSPGWLVLSRGYEKLLILAMGFELASHHKSLKGRTS